METNGHKVKVSHAEVMAAMHEHLDGLDPEQTALALHLLERPDRARVLSAVSELDGVWSALDDKHRSVSKAMFKLDHPFASVAFPFGPGRPKGRR